LNLNLVSQKKVCYYVDSNIYYGGHYIMAKTNYSYEKRGRELEKQKKQEEKRQKKLDKKNDDKNDDKKEENESKSSPDNSLES